MRTRALPFPIGRQLIGWVVAHVTDMWLYWRSPLGCHWRRNGGAAGLGNGVGAEAAVARLAAARGREEAIFPWIVLSRWPLLGMGSTATSQGRGRGVVPLFFPTPYCSTGDGFPVPLIRDFDRRVAGKGVSKRSLVRKLVFES